MLLWGKALAAFNSKNELKIYLRKRVWHTWLLWSQYKYFYKHESPTDLFNNSNHLKSYFDAVSSS